MPACRVGVDGGTRRQCAVTRASRAPDELIRFVVGPDGDVVPDIGRRLPGRGVWVTAAADTVSQAVRKGVFPRAFRSAVRVAPDLPDLVDSLLARSALGYLSLANKAGEAIFGFAKVEEAIAKGKVAGLIHAAEAAADGCRKLDDRLRRLRPQAVVVREFTGAELSLALGRPNVVHAAVTGGGASAGFLGTAARLDRYRAGGAAFDVA
jgi:predicted RNA-binding protein YlxR (DUF448 family)